MLHSYASVRRKTAGGFASMEKLQKARKWARRCFFVSVGKLAFCIIAVLFSGPAPTPDTPIFDHISAGWLKVGFCAFIVGVSLLPFYREALLKEPERVDTRRYVGFAFGLDGVVDLIRITWPHEWHTWLWAFTYPFVLFFMLAIHFDFSDPDDKPRKKRKFKAKWPAWIKKRWSPTPRQHRPQPQPHPQPSPRPTN